MYVVYLACSDLADRPPPGDVRRRHTGLLRVVRWSSAQREPRASLIGQVLVHDSRGSFGNEDATDYTTALAFFPSKRHPPGEGS